MTLLCDDDELRIRFVEGLEAKVSVISFTGVGGNLGGMQIDEFARSIYGAVPQCNVFYVIDKKRTWYGSVASRIVETIRPHLGSTKAITLGNSMGGFGAVLFGGLLPTDAALAFCPQFSVSPMVVPDETRWRKWREGLKHWDYETCLSGSSSGRRKVLFFGADERRERRHIALFLDGARGDTAVFNVAGCGHDVARHIKERGLLSKMIGLVVSGSSNEAIQNALDEGGVRCALMQQ
jgi:pimeloyl-ACP methyl ester carboxylesterase